VEAEMNHKVKISIVLIIAIILMDLIDLSYGSGPITNAENKKFFDNVAEELIENERGLYNFCKGNPSGPFITGSTITCTNKSGKVMKINGQDYDYFENGKITKTFFNFDDITYSFQYIRDPNPRVASVKISDGKNSITVSTGDGNPENYQFVDCYLPIMNETAAMSDPNGKGLGVSSTIMTKLINDIYLETSDLFKVSIIGVANSILRSASEREFFIEKIRKKFTTQPTKSKQHK